MANISIPNLPAQTATTDLDILVIVNSGETTTSKITINDLLAGNIPVFNSGTNLVNSYINATGNNGFGIALDGIETLAGNRNVLIGYNSNISDPDTNFGVVIGSNHNNAIRGNANYGNAILGGSGNYLQSGQYNTIVGAQNSYINAQSGAVLLGGSSQYINNSQSAAIVAGDARYILES